ncbi:MAG: hypothetical protein U0894_01775 [Pirellulales bacterium]
MKFHLVQLCMFAALCFVPATTNAQRKPIPEASSIRSSSRLVSEVFKTDIEAAKSTQQKLELLKRLTDEARATKDDISGKYALLQLALDLSIQVCDTSSANTVISEISNSFEVEKTNLQAKTTVSILKRCANSPNRDACLAASLELTDRLVSINSFPLAIEVVSAGLTLVESPKDLPKRKHLQMKRQHIEEIAKAFSELPTAKKIDGVHDAANARTLGRFECFFKGNWNEGIPLLEKCDDGRLKQLAERELDLSVDTTELGDEWWTYSETANGIVRANIQAHAANLYKQALPATSGLTKARISKRIEAIDAIRIKSIFPSSGLADTSEKRNPEIPSISGRWQEAPGIVFVINQRGNRFIAVTKYQAPNVGQIQAVIEGTILSDGKLVGILRHTQAPPDWKQQQRREGQLSENQTTISGMATFEGGGHEFVWERLK